MKRLQVLDLLKEKKKYMKASQKRTNAVNRSTGVKTLQQRKDCHRKKKMVSFIVAHMKWKFCEVDTEDRVSVGGRQVKQRSETAKRSSEAKQRSGEVETGGRLTFSRELKAFSGRSL